MVTEIATTTAVTVTVTVTATVAAVRLQHPSAHSHCT
jgi:hypothetical protein